MHIVRFESQGEARWRVPRRSPRPRHHAAARVCLVHITMSLLNTHCSRTATLTAGSVAALLEAPPRVSIMCNPTPTARRYISTTVETDPSRGHFVRPHSTLSRSGAQPTSLLESSPSARRLAAVERLPALLPPRAVQLVVVEALLPAHSRTASALSRQHDDHHDQHRCQHDAPRVRKGRWGRPAARLPEIVVTAPAVRRRRRHPTNTCRHVLALRRLLLHHGARPRAVAPRGAAIPASMHRRAAVAVAHVVSRRAVRRTIRWVSSTAVATPEAQNPASTRKVVRKHCGPKHWWVPGMTARERARSGATK